MWVSAFLLIKGLFLMVLLLIIFFGLYLIIKDIKKIIAQEKKSKTNLEYRARCDYCKKTWPFVYSNKIKPKPCPTCKTKRNIVLSFLKINKEFYHIPIK